MAYVIAEPCIGTKDSACVDACPVDCIHPKKDEPGFDEVEILNIEPVECIDCGACVPECPVEAIFDESQVPDDKKDWTKINADKAPALPVINQKVDPLPGAEERKEALGF